VQDISAVLAPGLAIHRATVKLAIGDNLRRAKAGGFHFLAEGTQSGGWQAQASSQTAVDGGPIKD